MSTPPRADPTAATGRPDRRTLAALALIPLGIAGLAAAVLALGDPDLAILLRLPLWQLARTIGGLVAAVGVIGALVRGRRHRARAEGIAEGRTIERHAHRRFLSRLDHELKNPVTAIRAAAAGLSAPGGPPERARLSAAVDEQAMRLSTLVGDLRKLADLESRPLERERVDVGLVIREAVEDIGVQAPAIGMGRRRIDVSLPRAPWPLPVIDGDLDLIYLAIHNLLNNAVKFSAAEAPIEVRGSEDAGWVIVEVADSGIGIPDDEVDAVFEELARGVEARGIPGSGIGLSLVRVIAERHGGDVSLRSRHGAGTSVRLRLPTRPDA